jgi:hypothetical protein
MKKSQSIISLILTLLVSSLYSQKDSLATSPPDVKSKPQFEIGINLYGLFIRPGDYFSHYQKVWDSQVFSGIYVKRYTGKNAIRASVEYSRRNVYFGKQPLSHNGVGKGQLASLELKLGFQRLLSSKKIAPYVFTDLEYTHFFRVSLLSPNYYLSSLSVPYYYDYNRYYTLAGAFVSISPGIGMRWTLTKNLLLNIESSAQFFLSREMGVRNHEPVNSIGLNVKPIKLSLGFKF